MLYFPVGQLQLFHYIALNKGDLMFKYISVLFVLLISTASITFAEGAITPEKLLPAGVDSGEIVNPYTGEKGQARKGTVGATINNIVVLNKLLQEKPTASTDKKIDEHAQAIMKLIPSLKVIALFDFFTVEEWLGNHDKQPGRALVAIFYLQKYPNEITPEIKTQLKQVENETNIQKLKAEIKKLS